MIKYRVVLGGGHVEFISLTTAETWRDVNAPGATILTVDEAATIDKDGLIHAAWLLANSTGLAYADENARARYILWLIDPAAKPSVKTKIIEIQTAMDSIWQHYYTVKAMITAGIPTVFDMNQILPCPHTFIDVITDAQTP